MNILITLLILVIPNAVLAHPGNTASDGCHYCRTNCDRWGEAWNVRHCHGGYAPPTYNYEPPPPRSYTPPPIPVNNTQSSYVDNYSYTDTNDTGNDSGWYIWLLLFGGGYWLLRKFKKQKVVPNTSLDEENEKVVENNPNREKDFYDEYQELQEPDDDVREIMESQDVDEDEAEEIRDLMDELGVDEDEAAEIKDSL